MNWIKTITLLLPVSICWAAKDSVPADNSGNGMLKGKYWVREVIPLPRAAFTGAMTFDGKGSYTFTGLLLAQSGAASHKTESHQITVNGTYRVGANGIAVVDNLARAADYLIAGDSILFGGVGANGILMGSDTETGYNDFLIAIPAGTAAPQNSALQGVFWIGDLDYGNGPSPANWPTTGRNSLFQITADGKGGFTDITIKGHDMTQRDIELTQVVKSPSYNFVSDGSASLNFPAPAGITATASLFTGTKALYVSGDGNYIVGGDLNGYDIFFGFRPLSSGTAVSDAYFGVYYFAGFNSDISDPTYRVFESSYGSINAFKGLKGFFHKRAVPFDNLNYDFNFKSGNGPLSSDGVLVGDSAKTVVGASGRIAMTVGSSTNYALTIGNLAPSVPVSSAVFLNPLGILNAASFSPITAGVSPGELITLFGSGLANTPATASIPFPTSLGGVQVMINDRPAPIYAVSSGQVSAIVPYATSGDWAKIQVINNGVASNAVTMYNRECSPGVFTLSAAGDGTGAVLHANYQVVNAANPAKQGEVVLIYATGLGAVSPTVTDGAPGPTSPLSTISDGGVFFGSTTGQVFYKGLAPGLAGLYQLNVQIPANAPIGDVLLDVEAGYKLSCVGYQATIPIVKGN